LQALQTLARRETAIRADETPRLQVLELGVNDIDRKRCAAAALHAALHIAVNDARRRDRRLRLVQDVQERELDVEVGDLLAGTDDHVSIPARYCLSAASCDAAA